MGQISLSLPSDGSTIEAADVNNPLNTILNEFNGNIDNNNIKSGAGVDGTKLLANSIPPTAYDANARAGWNSGIVSAPNTVTALGLRMYQIVFNSTDLSGYLSAGMRLRATRTVAAPTQSTSLNGTTQYYSKSSPSAMTFTDDFTVSAWVKLTSYGSDSTIASRYNGTSGWDFRIKGTGQIEMFGFNAGSSNFSGHTSYQSIPLNKWVHIAGQLDMSSFTSTTTTNYVMIDGVDVPTSSTRSGTNPTALIQAGNLEIGSRNGGLQPFPGKIAQIAIYNSKVTQATILASMHQTLTGSETSLISAYSFNNAITDLNTGNANNLTANGSAVATNADSPYGRQADGTISSTLEYAIITGVSFSTNTTVTVIAPEGCALPTSGGITAIAYSVHKIPYGFPDFNRVLVEIPYLSTFSNTTVAGVDISGATITFTPPTGKLIRIKAYGQLFKSGSAGELFSLTLYEDSTAIHQFQVNIAGSNYAAIANLDTQDYKPSSGSHTYKLNLSANAAGTMQFVGSTSIRSFFRIECPDL